VNLRGGWALIKATWASWMQYRSFFFILAFGWMIQPLIYLLVWSTAAGGKTIGGFSRGEFVAYYLVLILVNQLTYSQTNWTVGDLIHYGPMNRLLVHVDKAIDYGHVHLRVPFSVSQSILFSCVLAFLTS